MIIGFKITLWNEFKILQAFKEGYYAQKKNYYQPPVDEKERISYNLGWDETKVLEENDFQYLDDYILSKI